ncbi:3'-5' exonuclease [bacterium]|nr:3'-5' exonuclease [bacterium]
MLKEIHQKTWVFDSEWVPDPASGRELYRLPESLTDEAVLGEMWKEGGATADDPTPYLKTVLCRVVSISAVVRTTLQENVRLQLLSLPREINDPEQCLESHIIDTFLNAIGKNKPQLVGYNSTRSDLKILIQRGIARGIQAAEFCRRPAKPWEGVDYFARGSDYHIDLMEILGSWGKGSPSLNEMATVCGIPGKMELDGNAVAPLWLQGRLDQIIAYNEFDAVTTYLLWLRLAHFSGLLSHSAYVDEQETLKQLLMTESERPERAHLKQYLDEWLRLRSIHK